jgi:hypothetical protein
MNKNIITITQDQDDIRCEFNWTHEHVEYRMHWHIRQLTIKVSDEIIEKLKTKEQKNICYNLLNNN